LCKVVGLTGPTGAGKSSVSSFLRNNGYLVLDCDTFAKQVMDSDEECINRLKRAFPDCFDDSKLNRKKLGKFVFSDKNGLKLLNSIVNPLILKNLKKYVDDHADQTVILDGATLIECGASEICDCLIGILASSDIRVRRIMERDSLDRTDAQNRIASQHDDEFYKNNCTHVLYNDSDLFTVCSRVLQIIKEANHNE